MKDNIVKNKSFQFALRIIKLYKYLTNEHREYVLSKQLLRSGTAIGAMMREAEHAESKMDFIHKCSIALKECNESDYWIELLYQSDYLNEKAYRSLKNDNEEILKLLVTIIKTSKNNL
ncbi:MAG: four helix bundle protein [Bacteroidia bacterium]